MGIVPYTHTMDENILTPYGLASHPYIGTRALTPTADARFTSVSSGPGYLITLARYRDAPGGCCIKAPCIPPTDTAIVPLRVGQALVTDMGALWYPYMGVGARLYTHTPPYTFRYENTIDVPPYWAGALLAKGCSTNDEVTVPIPSREHYEVLEAYNTQFYYIDRIPRAALPASDRYPMGCYEGRLWERIATMPGVYGFISYLTYEGRPELSLDLEAVGILGLPWMKAFIPSNYQHAVYWERLAFLRGVMDYRGAITDKGVAQLFITSKAMLVDLHYLVRRLGGWTHITTCGCCDDPCGWLVDILLPNGESPFYVTPSGYVPPTGIQIPPWLVTGIEASPDTVVAGTVTPGTSYFIYPDVLVGEV